jgi:hypothetical protein
MKERRVLKTAAWKFGWRPFKAPSFDAIGVRLYQLPTTLERILEEMQSSGMG